MMDWISFLLWVSGIYIFYYSANIAFDLLKATRVDDFEDQDVIALRVDFGDDEVPAQKAVDGQEIDYFIDRQDAASIQSPIYASAGVNIRQLFELARSESIEFTGRVNY